MIIRNRFEFEKYFHEIVAGTSQLVRDPIEGPPDEMRYNLIKKRSIRIFDTIKFKEEGSSNRSAA